MNYAAVPLLHIYPKAFVWDIIHFLPIGCSASLSPESMGRNLLLQMFNKSAMIQRRESTLAFMKEQERQMLPISLLKTELTEQTRFHSQKGYLNGNIKPNSEYLECTIQKETGLDNQYVKLVMGYLYKTHESQIEKSLQPVTPEKTKRNDQQHDLGGFRL